MERRPRLVALGEHDRGGGPQENGERRGHGQILPERRCLFYTAIAELQPHQSRRFGLPAFDRPVIRFAHELRSLRTSLNERQLYFKIVASGYPPNLLSFSWGIRVCRRDSSSACRPVVHSAVASP